MSGVLDAADGRQAFFRLPSSFVGFAGHFPGRPILPAVAQIQMACVLLAAGKGDGAPFSGPRRVDSAKFTRPVVPDEPVLVKVAAASGRWKAVLSVNGEKTAEFTFSIGEAPPCPA